MKLQWYQPLVSKLNTNSNINNRKRDLTWKKKSPFQNWFWFLWTQFKSIPCFHHTIQKRSLCLFSYEKLIYNKINTDKYRPWPTLSVFVYLWNLIVFDIEISGLLGVSDYPVLVHIHLPETDNCPSWNNGRERMTVENISGPISMKERCRIWRIEPLTSDHQSDSHPTQPPMPALFC